jgi:hypothetical protein
LDKAPTGCARIDLVAFKLVLALEPLKTIEEADRLTVLAVLLHGDDVYLDAALKTVAHLAPAESCFAGAQFWD